MSNIFYIVALVIFPFPIFNSATLSLSEVLFLTSIVFLTCCQVTWSIWRCFTGCFVAIFISVYYIYVVFDCFNACLSWHCFYLHFKKHRRVICKQFYKILQQTTKSYCKWGSFSLCLFTHKYFFIIFWTSFSMHSFVLSSPKPLWVSVGVLPAAVGNTKVK